MNLIDVDSEAEVLSAAFGITWDPDVMGTEEPHIFKAAALTTPMKTVTLDGTE